MDGEEPDASADTPATTFAYRADPVYLPIAAAPGTSSFMSAPDALPGMTANAEVHTYPVGHFDIYVGDAFEQAVADSIDFLNRHVPVGV